MYIEWIITSNNNDASKYLYNKQGDELFLEIDFTHDMHRSKFSKYKSMLFTNLVHGYKQIYHLFKGLNFIGPFYHINGRKSIKSIKSDIIYFCSSLAPVEYFRLFDEAVFNNAKIAFMLSVINNIVFIKNYTTFPVVANIYSDIIYSDYEKQIIDAVVESCYKNQDDNHILLWITGYANKLKPYFSTSFYLLKTIIRCIRNNSMCIEYNENDIKPCEQVKTYISSVNPMLDTVIIMCPENYTPSQEIVSDIYNLSSDIKKKMLIVYFSTFDAIYIPDDITVQHIELHEKKHQLGLIPYYKSRKNLVIDTNLFYE